MPSYADKSAFFENGLEPYTATTPPPPPEPGSHAAISGPLFDALEPSPPVTADKIAEPASSPPSPLAPSIELPTCPICLDPLSPTPPTIRIRACTHGYHEACLSLWLDIQNTCPACRAVLFTRSSDLGHRQPASPPREQAGRPGLQHWRGEESAVSAEMPGPVGDAVPVRRAGRRDYGVGPWDAEGRGNGVSLYQGASEWAEREGGRLMPGSPLQRGSAVGRRRVVWGLGRSVSPEAVDAAGRGRRGERQGRRGGRPRVVGGGFGISGW